MEQSYKVIQVKITEMFGDSYKYVSKITTDDIGNIKVLTSENILMAMRFNDWEVLDLHEKKLRNKFLDFIKSYFPNKDYEITYHNVKICY